MTTSTITFAALGRRARIEPVVLIAGLPVVFTVSGTIATATAVSAGTVDALWWPGTGTLTQTLPDSSSWNPVRDLLDPQAVWSLRAALDLVKGDVRVEPLPIDLFDRGGEATALLSRRSAATGQLLAAECSATASVVTLASTTGFASAGIAHFGREAIGYTGKTSTELTGVTRGLFGSSAMAHRLGSTVGASDPLVTAGTLPRYLQGRRATVWLCEVDGATLRDPTLVFSGIVGAGVTMVRNGTRWQITLDPLTEVISRAPDLPVELFGWHHLADSPSPLRAPGGRMGPTHNGGWSPNLEAVIEVWRASLMVSTSIELTVSEGRLRVTNLNSGGSNPPHVPVEGFLEPLIVWVPPQNGFSFESAPDTCLVLEGWIKLQPNDFARVPSTLSYAVTSPAPGSANFALIADTDNTEHFAAFIATRNASANTIQLAARSVERFADRLRAARITKRTTAKIGVIASGSNCIGPLKALAVALGQLGGVDDFAGAVDWDRIAAVFRTVPSVGLPEGREYEIGAGDDTVLTLLADEARLRGATLTMRAGLVSVVRAASFAASEAVGVTEITSADVLTDGGVPIPFEVIDQPEPPATSISFEMRDGTVLRFTDDTYAQEFGSSTVVECRALRWMPADAFRLGLPAPALAAASQQVLGVLAEPQRIVKLVLGQPFMGLEPGDIVLLTHDEIPAWDGTRGVTGAICQVDEVSRELFGGKARITASLRLSETGLGGYAPAALVAAGGLSGGSTTVQLDTTTGFGTSCFAPVGESPTYGFEVGDVVVLSQYDARTVTVTEIQRTITAVDRTLHRLTIDSAPSAGMVTQAAAQYGVVVRTAAWTQATAAPVGDVAAQRDRLAFVADDATQAFSDSAPAKRFAA